MLFPKNLLFLSPNSLIFQITHTKSVFNSVINSQVMDSFSLLLTPRSPIPSKQDLVSPEFGN
ncbi:MAG: hypothetical protein EWV75_12620 [Microcystis wesenbergii Mw_QC_S_20081001_S30D]|uniref:Uncharacterized protein n=2 Tax=Microcystis wesenbergii TaxID=44823 RepID=A0A552MC16_9CHRO|nr:MAG: hypothetical protein EWV75_12620 [Microcystis wesenbergii Mw_QC_S_20081001_S30D]TRV01349.1 MAG: hypothetical protein EWV73_09605 [Microcystis wesenbergii Mw_QC_B_20070930_S4D]TRV02229.1 MAG: hypothetical protein EWV74_09245 [Microcystis wesenbergii Mw_QC_S_20081001_S30]TRV07964.1 MAG: hypothetical protein EWV41_11440 [Microcystis wesenbergii Mw_MB_S_20031200_S109]TRV15384.1 MAG: hypothetical protein EWV89_07720 [Microcystis wesenbergii Mw_QC_B_20070930_S4]TRV30002.1 MAG: hypothetical p